MENQQDIKKQKQHKFLLFLPVITLPFLTLMFWALGGGQGQLKAAPTPTKGLNSVLPGASLTEDKGLDKMAYYEKAAKDSAARTELIKNDPFYQGQYDPLRSQFPDFSSVPQPSNYHSDFTDPNEAKIYQRLGLLNHAISQNDLQQQVDAGYPTSWSATPSNEGYDQLSKAMEAVQQSSSGDDPEMKELNQMLDKIMDIQNPGRQQEKLRELSEQRKGRVFAISKAREPEKITLLEAKPTNDSSGNKFSVSGTGQDNGFYSLDESSADAQDQNAVSAVIAQTQTIVNGSTVKMRLLDDIYINGKLIPKDQFVFGIAALNGERLEIKIPSIRFGKSVYPVSLSIMDIDGLEGIYIPGAIARDVAKESSERAIQDLSFGTSMSNSIGIQAAGAGMEAAKSLFSRKVKLIKVTLKAGYQILLQDDKQKQDN